MVKGRMLTVIKYLEKHRETEYRQITEGINETTRAIRYDIDKINDELSLKKLPLIEKLSKGKIKVPEDPFKMILKRYRKN